jgi:uncharacterized protein (DUF885 family)
MFRRAAPSLAAVLVLASACAAPAPSKAPPLVASATSTSAMAPPPATTSAAAPDTSDDAAIAAAGKDYLDLVRETSPEQATALGLHERDTELDDRSAEGEARTVARTEAMLTALRERFKAPHASRAARTDLAILEHELAVSLERRRAIRPLERRPEAYIEPLNALFLMIAREYAPAPDRAKAFVARLEKIPALVAAAKVNLKNPPRVWTETALEDAKHAQLFFDGARPFLEGALPDDKAHAARALAGAKEAYADLATFLQKDLLPRSTGSFAAGRTYFDFLLHQNYFLDEDADAVLAIGKRIFDETDAQMTELAKRIDPKAKGWPEVTRRLKANHPTAEDLIPSYRRELERARAFLVEKNVVPFPAGDDCSVIETPAFERSTITAAYDAAPAFDTKTTRGYFFVTPVDKTLSKAKQEEMLRENDRADQVDTVVHEAYPGHHLQLSFARLHPSLVRKATGPSIFSEGWALYSEELLAELGYYNDEQRLIQLEWTLVRAARVILDVGLHTQGMTFDDAVKILTDRVHLEHQLAQSEVRRYAEDPTQPLAYLIGREMLFKLRDRYKQREGEKYTLLRFHTEVLSHGTIAPGLLAQEIFEP